MPKNARFRGTPADEGNLIPYANTSGKKKKAEAQPEVLGKDGNPFRQVEEIDADQALDRMFRQAVTWSNDAFHERDDFVFVSMATAALRTQVVRQKQTSVDADVFGELDKALPEQLARLRAQADNVEIEVIE